MLKAAGERRRAETPHTPVLKTYLPILVFGVLGLTVGGVFAMLNHLIGPKKPKVATAASRRQSEPYESGIPVEAMKNFRFGISFYLLAMLFILFDIEVVFLYPVGVILKPAHSVFVLGELVTFVVLADGRLRLRLAKGCIGLEIERRSLPARQATARDMLRGDLEGEDLEKYVEEKVVTTTFEKMLNLARANSIFPLTFGLACCAIEAPISIVTARYDLARFGAEALRASPRQADLIILSGRVSIKMAPVVRRLYDQMLEPKWAISMGACSSSGGMFANYAVVQGADKFMPIDLHVPGCPPRPEAVMYGFNKLQRKIIGEPDQGWRQRYNAAGTEEWARGGPASKPSPEAAEAYGAARELTLA